MAQTSWPVEEFRALLDRILSETGLTQAALAALVPMDQSQLSRWKSGSSRPKYENLAALAAAVEQKYPNVSITKREILASGGYAATLSEPVETPHDSQLRVLDGENERHSSRAITTAEFWDMLDRDEIPETLPGGFRDGLERDQWAKWVAKHRAGTGFYTLREAARSLLHLRELSDQADRWSPRDQTWRDDPRREA